MANVSTASRTPRPASTPVCAGWRAIGVAGVATGEGVGVGAAVHRPKSMSVRLCPLANVKAAVTPVALPSESVARSAPAACGEKVEPAGAVARTV